MAGDAQNVGMKLPMHERNLESADPTDSAGSISWVRILQQSG